MLNDTCPRCLNICVVHSCITLEIRLIKSLILKTDRTILQCSKLIIKVCVNGTCVDNLLSHSIILSLLLKVILIQTNLNAVQEVRYHLRISANRDSLIKSIEIVVIKSQTNRKSLDDKGRKLCAWTSPLLLCITLDQLLIDICTNQADCLLLKILRLCDTSCLTLLLDLLSSLLRSHNTPHLIEGIHIKRKAVQLTMIIGNRAVCKTVELRKLCNIIPDLLIIGMENMCTILMNIDSLNLLCVHVSCNIRAFVDHENRFARLLRLMSKDSTVKTGAYDKIIVHSFFSLLFDVIILTPVLRVWQVFFFTDICYFLFA